MDEELSHKVREAANWVHPKSLDKMKVAVETKNAKALSSILHPSNKYLRVIFEEVTGRKLPKTVGGTNKAIEDWLV